MSIQNNSIFMVKFVKNFCGFASYPELYAVVGSRVPDYQGMFLRGHGSQSFTQVNGTTINKGLPTETIHASGNLGVIQGDAIRNIQDRIDIVFTAFTGNLNKMIFYSSRVWGPLNVSNSSGGPHSVQNIYLDTSRAVPTANENRPVNKAVRYLIRAKS